MTYRQALKRIDRHIAELIEIRRQNYLKVCAEVDFDKAQYRRGNYDAAPLLELVDRRVQEYRVNHIGPDNRTVSLGELCEVRGLNVRAILRIRQTGWVTPRMADLICCRLGVPTVCVYPYEQMSLDEAV